jgi:hypothetical protein
MTIKLRGCSSPRNIVRSRPAAPPPDKSTPSAWPGPTRSPSRETRGPERRDPHRTNRAGESKPRNVWEAVLAGHSPRRTAGDLVDRHRHGPPRHWPSPQLRGLAPLAWRGYAPARPSRWSAPSATRSRNTCRAALEVHRKANASGNVSIAGRCVGVGARYVGRRIIVRIGYNRGSGHRRRFADPRQRARPHPCVKAPVTAHEQPSAFSGGVRGPGRSARGPGPSGGVRPRRRRRRRPWPRLRRRTGAGTTGPAMP